MDAYDVTTTFFVVGDWVEKYPESVLALADAGHEIQSHSDDHAHYNDLSEAALLADLQSANDRIAAVTGVTPTLIRCPYGEYNNTVISTIRSIGMEPIQWDVDSLDWMELSAAEIVERVTTRVTNGSIVLFHNAAINTPEALPTILETLISQGYAIVPISALILSQPYTIDHTGRQFAA